MAIDPQDLCGCCEGLRVEVPAEPGNPPSLSAVAYRIGDWGRFKRSLLARLSSAEAGPLAALTTREDDDFTIALLDAWAAVGDVLTFYQERLFAEGKLRTAEELRSLHEQARLIGWRPSPGVAAAADLAFTMDESATSPRSTVLSVGIKVQSTPGPDEVPATYETIEAIQARPRWNALRPRLSRLQVLTGTTTRIWLPGVDVRVREGDGIFFRSGGENVFATVRAVERRPADRAVDPDQRDLTVVDITRIGGAPLHDAGDAISSVSLAPPPPANFYFGQTLDAAELSTQLTTRGDDEAAVFAPFERSQATAPLVAIFRLRAAMFGHNAPAFGDLPSSLTGDTPIYGPSDDGPIIITGSKSGPYKGLSGQWADGNLTVLGNGTATLHLAAPHPEIAPGEAIVLRDGASWGLYHLDDVAEASYSRFTISARATRIVLDSTAGFGSLTIRGTTAYADMEWIALAPEPLTAAVSDASVLPLELEGFAPGLEPGRKVAATGRTPAGGEQAVAEIVTIKSVEHDMRYGGGTRITLSPALASTYTRDSLRFNANVAQATHGESVFEILGSGDAARPFQAFTAQQKPQTHVSAPVPSGAKPTLEMRVNDVLWRETPDFLDSAPDARVYVTRIDEEGRTHIRFGDGATGARPPSGAEIRARYRKGLGLAGRVRAGQLDVLMSRPLGLKAASNPLPSSGGADPDGQDAIRESAPLTVRALERTVSLRDYEDLALGLAGIAKAQAVMRSLGAERRVFLTVAGEQGEAVAEPGTLHDQLTKGLANAGDPYARHTVRSYRPAVFRLALTVTIDPDYLPDQVLDAVDAQLRASFGFESRRFAQPVWLSEVIAAVHAVAGVGAVDVDKLYRDLLPDGTPGVAALNRGVVAEPARPDAGAGWLGAELLTLHPGPLDHLGVMT